jgi:hypothetical protein
MTRGSIRKFALRTLLTAPVALACMHAHDAAAFDALMQQDQNPQNIVTHVRDVMQQFGAAIKQKNMSGFHASPLLSTAFAKQYSVEQMNAGFKSMMDSGVDLTTLNELQPVLDSAQVDPAHQLIVNGHYPSTPPARFEMHFVREGAKFGLSSIDVHIHAGNETPPLLTKEQGLPDAATLSALSTHMKAAPGVKLPAEQMGAVRAAMHAFAVGIKKKNMGEFLQADIVSQRWREQQTAAQLDAAYRNTLATGGDFTLLDQLVPVIPDAPSTDQYGVLNISGYYDDPSARIGFKMGFVAEAGELRVVNFAIVPGRARR